MKICVIGNSHAGSLKRGWDVIKESFPLVHLTFFAQRRQGLADLGIINDSLHPLNDQLKEALIFTSSGKEFIDPCEYDLFLLYGLNTKPYFPLDHFYSEGALRQAILDFTDGSLSGYILGLLREITYKPIFIGHNPLPAATKIVNRDSSRYELGMKIMNEYSNVDINTKFLAQPIDTVVNGFKTDPFYSIASKRLAVGDDLDDEDHPLTDRSHMNDAFGALWLKNLFSLIDDASL